MSRWIRYLTEKGLVVGDGVGEHDEHLTLSIEAIIAIERYLEDTQKCADAFGTGGDVRGAA